MKKSKLIIASMTFFFFASLVSAEAFKLSISPKVIFPLDSASVSPLNTQLYATSFGADVSLDYSIGKQVDVRLSGGYLRLEVNSASRYCDCCTVLGGASLKADLSKLFFGFAVADVGLCNLSYGTIQGMLFGGDAGLGLGRRIGDGCDFVFEALYAYSGGLDGDLVLSGIQLDAGIEMEL
jgi:hypothetical protein